MTKNYISVDSKRVTLQDRIVIKVPFISFICNSFLSFVIRELQRFY